MVNDTSTKTRSAIEALSQPCSWNASPRVDTQTHWGDTGRPPLLRLPHSAPPVPIPALSFLLPTTPERSPTCRSADVLRAEGTARHPGRVCLLPALGAGLVLLCSLTAAGTYCTLQPRRCSAYSRSTDALALWTTAGAAGLSQARVSGADRPAAAPQVGAAVLRHADAGESTTAQPAAQPLQGMDADGLWEGCCALFLWCRVCSVVCNVWSGLRGFA